MNETTNNSLPRAPIPHKDESRLKNVQLRVPKDLYQRIDMRLEGFNQRTGMNLSFAMLTLQTLEEHWMIQLERAEKSYERYRRRKDNHGPNPGTPAAPPMLQQ